MLDRDLMSSSVTTVQPQASIPEAARRMLDNNVSCLPVADEQGHLVGQLIHPDFGLHPRFRPRTDNVYSLLGASATPRHIQEVSRAVSGKLIKEVMHRPVITIKEDAPIAEVIQPMINRASTGCP